MTSLDKETSLKYLEKTINLAKNSPPKPTNFRVGCVIVSFQSEDKPEILSTGYTLELPGNTHAEQCALAKLDSTQSDPSTQPNTTRILTPECKAVLYTSLEPCGKRLSGNTPCVQRIIGTRSADLNGGIRKVVFGAKEPGTFVQDSQSCRLLTEAGIEWEYVPDLEREILKVAMEGHVPKKDGAAEGTAPKETKPVEDKEQKDQSQSQAQTQAAAEAAPRNPKKRMMETI